MILGHKLCVCSLTLPHCHWPRGRGLQTLFQRQYLEFKGEIIGKAGFESLDWMELSPEEYLLWNVIHFWLWSKLIMTFYYMYFAESEVLIFFYAWLRLLMYKSCFVMFFGCRKNPCHFVWTHIRPSLYGLLRCIF